ncbi:MAG: alpha/beta hydrolase [Actinobacteria bacterium]|nr:alpha/beta hydrolase [Actinomycetota bacterium]
MATATAPASITLETGVTLSYAERGDGSRPPVVLLPGPTDSWRSYEQVLDRMPKSTRTIAVSQRGHGDSDKPATGYRVEDFAGDAISLLDALDIEAAVLVGHSGSCLVTRRVAIAHPDRVAGLVLEASPSTLVDDPGVREFVDSVVCNLDDPIDPAFARSFVIDTSSGDVAPALLDTLAGELMKVPARVWRETFAGLQEYDDLAELSRVTAPALLLWGDADPLVGRHMQEELLRRMASATLIAYPGLGHTPRWEDPARFAADLTAFVERLPFWRQ